MFAREFLRAIPKPVAQLGGKAFIAIIRIGGIQLGEELFQLPKPQKRRKP